MLFTINVLRGGPMHQRITRVALSLAFLLLCGAAGPAPLVAQGKDRKADQSAIRSVLEAQQAAWNRGDLTAFVVGYWQSPELTFSGSDGVERGYDGVLSRYRKSYPDRAAMGQLDFSDLEFRFLGNDAALVLGRWHLKRTTDELGGVFSLVWQRFPEGWKIIHDHTSLLKTRSGAVNSQ
jgi:ketosteroid isomerase-like protein